MFIFFFEQETAYEMRISDWSSDVCSSDLMREDGAALQDSSVVAGDYAERGGEGESMETVAADAQRIPCFREGQEIGRASCRERVCESVQILVVAVSLKKENEHLRQQAQLRETTMNTQTSAVDVRTK